MIKIASWNVNSTKTRVEQVTNWLEEHEPDVLLLQELKGVQFPSETFRGLGYESLAVTQKAIQRGCDSVALADQGGEQELGWS